MRRLLLLILAIAASSSRLSAQSLDVDRELHYCQSQVQRTLVELAPIDYTQTPRNIASGKKHWNLRNAKTPEEWCSGFFPGILWMSGSMMRQGDTLTNLSILPIAQSMTTTSDSR